MFNPQSRKDRRPWGPGDDPLWLLTPEEFERFPDWYWLTGIDGSHKLKGVDRFDGYTDRGLLAWGVRESRLHAIHYIEPEEEENRS